MEIEIMKSEKTMLRMTSVHLLFPGLLLLGACATAQNLDPDPDRNFEQRCQAEGVLKCFGYDDEIPGVQNGAIIDNNIKVSGAGSMFVDIPGTAGGAPGNAVTALGEDFGEGSSLYLQWRQRFTQSMIDQDLGGQGFKQFVIYDAFPGGDIEVTMLNRNYLGFPQFYTAMGRHYLEKEIGGKTALMWNGDEVICTTEDVSSCKMYEPDQWMTFYYEQHIGNWGQANSTINIYMAAEGEPLQQIIHFDDWTFDGSGTGAYRTIWIGPYSLGRTAGGHPDAATWIDEFIISEQPIADPYVPGTSPDDLIAILLMMDED